MGSHRTLDFESAYFNASGNTKQKLVLNKLGKLLKQRKPVIIEALRNAKIKVKQNATPRQIIRLIKSNPHNDKLRQNLGATILFDNEMVKGERDKFDNQYSTLVGPKKDGSQRKGLNLGSVFSSNNPDKVKGQGWDKFKSIFTGDPNKEKKDWGSTKVGAGLNNIFQGQTDDDGNKQPSKARDFFNQNQSEIWSFGTNVLGGLFTDKGEDEVMESVETTPSNSSNESPKSDPDKDTGMNPMWLIGGAVAVIGIIIVVVVASKGKTPKPVAN
jgi:hypothetical protein